MVGQSVCHRRRINRFALVCVLLLTLQAHETFPHPGGLDAYGCHHVRATGEYHCHRAPAEPHPTPGPSRVPKTALDLHQPPVMLERPAVRHFVAPPVQQSTPAHQPQPSPLADPDWIAVTLLTVVDGDTIHVADMQGRRIKVRLYGIDAPEQDQPGGAESTAALRRLLSGRRLSMRTITVDRHGRDVALIAADKWPVNETMIRQGYAWTFTRYCKLDFCAAWELAEFVALGSRLGIWGLPPPAIPPWDWRRGEWHSVSYSR